MGEQGGDKKHDRVMRHNETQTSGYEIGLEDPARKEKHKDEASENRKGLDECVHEEERQPSEDTRHEVGMEKQYEKKTGAKTKGLHEQERRRPEEGQIQLHELERKQREEIMHWKTQMQIRERYEGHCVL